ncbi:hypothetical protein Poly51_16140 [Rubripirellula tenax]|uniref:PepSY-associated TM helix n=1 Tax=Rubripirellula tenax TaxID=2528015 RepID=A0A5C6FF55_9BACT|nr:PepSY domain-containing protein [Rubripirellula tenax]TWU58834.1 hypothetical protein Poly51_16140 [Rubripirellula tenax]
MTNETESKNRKRRTRFTMVLRRVHLYAGLFLLPWVFLYGITGAMFNHYGLFSEANIVDVPSSALSGSALDDFPSADLLAQQVVEQLRLAVPDAKIEMVDSHQPEFVNDVILQVKEDKIKHLVHIDPVAKSAWVASSPDKKYQPDAMLAKIRNVDVPSRPYELAKTSVASVLESAGIGADGKSEPQGWCKLNFLATVDGTPARVTYVLRDGHVDVSKFEGKSGMSPRQFFMRLHTSHGRPPHWNARMMWSLFVDIMACAMVGWGVTGLVMWWQIKRTRLIGGAVMMLSIATAIGLYYGMIHFYAASKL